MARRKPPVYVAQPLVPNATMVNSGMRCQITFDDRGPDERGRRHFTMDWDQTPGDITTRRGQCYHAVPSEHFTLDTPEAES